jgi:hypothetical protein
MNKNTIEWLSVAAINEKCSLNISFLPFTVLRIKGVECYVI